MPLRNLKFIEKGFSLVEIMVAIAVIGIISAVSLGSISQLQKTGRDAQRESDLRIIQSALQQYYADQNKYPGIEALGSGATSLKSPDGTKTYLNQIPKDPTGTVYFYRPTESISLPDNTCSVASGTCHYYFLCAEMESPPDGSTCSALTGGANNFQVTPL